MKDLLKHIARIDATLDRDDKVLFCSNYKVASISVNQGVLGKKRGIRSKHGLDRYNKKLFSYSLDDIDKLFKFTIVRNPYRRLVSSYEYLLRMKMLPGGVSFEDFIKGLKRDDLMYPFYKDRVNAHCSFQYPRAYFKGNLFVNFVAKLENIKRDWQVIAPYVGVKKLPHSNKRKNKKNYRIYYNKRIKGLVTSLYREDIERFGYDFT